MSKYTELEGRSDYENGVPHESGKGEAYDTGYGMGSQKDFFERLKQETDKRERREQAQ